MASSTSANSDLNSRPSVSSAVIPNYTPNPNPSIPNASKSGFLTNIYAENPPTPLESSIPLIDAAVGECGQTSRGGDRKTVDDVWREIVAGKECKVEAPDEMMTLEDFLAKAGAVEEEDVKASLQVPPPTTDRLNSGGFCAFDPVMQSLYPPPAMAEGQVMGFGDGIEVIGGRGKRRGGPILEPIDRAAQQRQKRKIKNRESAARSRERKQAYEEELESLAGRLEEENDQLQREKIKWKQERYKQLMERVVPVVEKKRPPRPLRRVLSMQW